MTNYSYEENRNLEIKIAQIIKDKIYNVLYPHCTIIDNRNKKDPNAESMLQTILKTKKISDEEIRKMMDCRMSIDTIIINKFRQLISFQEKTNRWGSWNNKYYWTENLPKLRIRFQRKIYFEDTNVSRIYDAELSRILADMYLVIYLNQYDNEIQEWVMLDVSIIKQIISQVNDLKEIGEYVDMGMSDEYKKSAESFYSFSIFNFRQAIIVGSELFKEYIKTYQLIKPVIKNIEVVPTFN